MGMPPPPPRLSRGDAPPPPPPTFAEGAQRAVAVADDPLRVARSRPPRGAPPVAPPDDAPSIPGYDAPEWGGVGAADVSPGGFEEEGAIVDVVRCAGRARLAFGRVPGNDVVLEHPSASRLHAVLQFKRDSDEMFLHDAGSTHGTFVNRRKLKPRVHAPVFVGDQIRFGQSSRVFCVAGAAELMPEEGLSRDERRKLRALEKMSRDEAERLRRETEARGNPRGADDRGGDDAEDRSDGDEDEASLADAEDADWREHLGEFTEKQRAKIEKIRAKEAKLRNLRAEVERIRAKESERTPLSQGQARQIERNELAAEKLEEEIEDADEALNDALRDARRGGRRENARERKATATAGGHRGRKKNPRAGSESDPDASDDDDDFYDRTAYSAARRRRKERGRAEKTLDAASGGGTGGTSAPAAEVETAATLWEKRTAVESAIAALEADLREAKAREASKAAAAAAAEDSSSAASSADALDAFMAGVAASTLTEEATVLARRIAEKRSDLARLERLTRLADPRGEYAPGTARAKTLERLAENARAADAAEAARRRSERTRRREGGGGARDRGARELRAGRRAELIRSARPKAGLPPTNRCRRRPSSSTNPTSPFANVSNVFRVWNVSRASNVNAPRPPRHGEPPRAGSRSASARALRRAVRRRRRRGRRRTRSGARGGGRGRRISSGRGRLGGSTLAGRAATRGRSSTGGGGLSRRAGTGARASTTSWGRRSGGGRRKKAEVA